MLSMTGKLTAGFGSDTHSLRKSAQRKSLSAVTLFFWLSIHTGYCQYIMYSTPGNTVVYRTGTPLVPEHGFLPGKKFPIYPTLGNYDFKGLHLGIILYDDRPVLNLSTLGCSDIPLNNTSEFSSQQTIFKIGTYVDSLFHQSGIQIDSAATDRVEVHLEALDARLFGFGYVRVHGLCQLKIRFNDETKTYCTDIVDGDPHAGLGSNDFVTRKTATRYMASAAVRENLEKFLTYLTNTKK
jgi:hypothetical protein